MHTYSISLVVIEREINPTLNFLENFCTSRHSAAMINACEITKRLDIGSTPAETGCRGKNAV